MLKKRAFRIFIYFAAVLLVIWSLAPHCMDGDFQHNAQQSNGAERTDPAGQLYGRPV